MEPLLMQHNGKTYRWFTNGDVKTDVLDFNGHVIEGDPAPTNVLCSVAELKAMGIKGFYRFVDKNTNCINLLEILKEFSEFQDYLDLGNSLFYVTKSSDPNYKKPIEFNSLEDLANWVRSTGKIVMQDNDGQINLHICDGFSTDNEPKNLNLYLISQSVNNDYDTYDSAVVVAATEADARLIHPRGNNDYSCWAKPEDVEVEYIGVADLKLKGCDVIVSSFNPG